MKNYKLIALLVAFLAAGNLSAQQYDDMYYDPAKDKVFSDDYTAPKNDYKSEKIYTRADDEQENFDNEASDYYTDYDYYYSSRIRRFQRPFYGFSFFDPVYVDMSYYDPFMSPGMTMLIYDNSFAFNNFYGRNRWNRWNDFGGYGYNGWNSGFGYGLNSWNNFGPSYYGYGGFNNYYNNFGGGYYCPPTWGSGYSYNTIDNIRNNSSYGPRKSGSTRVPTANDRETRRDVPATTNPRTAVSSPDVRTRDSGSDSEVSERARAQSERRRAVESGSTPREREVTPRQNTERQRERTITPSESRPRTRESAEPRTRSSEPQRSVTPSRDNSSSRSSGSSSSPRSSGSSRRGGN